MQYKGKKKKGDLEGGRLEKKKKMKKTSLKSFLNEIEENDNVEEGVLKQNNTLTRKSIASFKNLHCCQQLEVERKVKLRSFKSFHCCQQLEVESKVKLRSFKEFPLLPEAGSRKQTEAAKF